MKKPGRNQERAVTDQVVTVPTGSENETKPDSDSKERLDAQSMSYRRSRDVALMKLAFLRPGNHKAA
jgi:hypothetical protein